MSATKSTIAAGMGMIADKLPGKKKPAVKKAPAKKPADPKKKTPGVVLEDIPVKVAPSAEVQLELPVDSLTKDEATPLAAAFGVPDKAPEKGACSQIGWLLLPDLDGPLYEERLQAMREPTGPDPALLGWSHWSSKRTRLACRTLTLRKAVNFYRKHAPFLCTTFAVTFRELLEGKKAISRLILRNDYGEGDITITIVPKHADGTASVTWGDGVEEVFTNWGEAKMGIKAKIRASWDTALGAK